MGEPVHQPPAGLRAAGNATRSFAIGHPASDGHFPGNPIIPGAVLLREIVTAIRSAGEVVGRPMSGCQIRSAKFQRPVRPGDTLMISWIAVESGDVRFSGSVDDPTRPVVTGVLRLAPA